MPKKETLMCIARCKTKDGRILDYYVHRIAGDVVIIGPNLERHRCHPGVTNEEAARLEIAIESDWGERISCAGPSAARTARLLFREILLTAKDRIKR